MTFETAPFETLLSTWLVGQRWYAGKGQGLHDLAIISDTALAEVGDAVLRHLIVSVSHGTTVDSYQLFVGLRPALPDELQYAAIGESGGMHVYDALHDSELTRPLLRGIKEEQFIGPLQFRRAEHTDAIFDLAADSLVLTGEQSNTSLVYGEEAILKVFRRLAPGPNPDLEVASALARLGSPHVAEPYGWIETRLEGASTVLAILSRYLRAASDGWSLAAASVRDLYATVEANVSYATFSSGSATFSPGSSSATFGSGSGSSSSSSPGSSPGSSVPLAPSSPANLHRNVPTAQSSPLERANRAVEPAGLAGRDSAASAGGDFAPEAERLGMATAQVHADLADAFGTDTLAQDAIRDMAEQMYRRLDLAVAAVPELARYADMIGTGYKDLAKLSDPIPVQRVHGDYHLGQVMRTQTGWVVLDFEGEPASPLAQRRARSSPLRDVAGLLRSFDYAARHQLIHRADSLRLAAAASDWVRHNSAAFMRGYASGGGEDPRVNATLLRALTLDKAVYEVMYEARHRPSWLPIPLESLAEF